MTSYNRNTITAKQYKTNKKNIDKKYIKKI